MQSRAATRSIRNIRSSKKMVLLKMMRSLKRTTVYWNSHCCCWCWRWSVRHRLTALRHRFASYELSKPLPHSVQRPMETADDVASMVTKKATRFVDVAVADCVDSWNWKTTSGIDARRGASSTDRVVVVVAVAAAVVVDAVADWVDDDGEDVVSVEWERSDEEPTAAQAAEALTTTTATSRQSTTRMTTTTKTTRLRLTTHPLHSVDGVERRLPLRPDWRAESRHLTSGCRCCCRCCRCPC